MTLFKFFQKQDPKIVASDTPSSKDSTPISSCENNQKSDKARDIPNNKSVGFVDSPACSASPECSSSSIRTGVVTPMVGSSTVKKASKSKIPVKDSKDSKASKASKVTSASKGRPPLASASRGEIREKGQYVVLQGKSAVPMITLHAYPYYCQSTIPLCHR